MSNNFKFGYLFIYAQYFQRLRLKNKKSGCNHKVKKKTEICLNFKLQGSCQYSENCSFAHGEGDLKQQPHQNSNLKTKPCKNFHKIGGCSYGIRCQYMHSEIKDQIKWWGYLKKQLRRSEVPFTFAWDKKDKIKQEERIDITRFKRVVHQYEQLPIFKRLTNSS